MLRSPLNPPSQSAAEIDERLRLAIAEEMAGMEANRAMARERLPELLARIQPSLDLIAQLRAAREAAGVSLDEMQQRTGMPKSAISRLENSKNPNPTLATLRRYARAIGKRLVVDLEEEEVRSEE